MVTYPKKQKLEIKKEKTDEEATKDKMVQSIHTHTHKKWDQKVSRLNSYVFNINIFNLNEGVINLYNYSEDVTNSSSSWSSSRCTERIDSFEYLTISVIEFGTFAWRHSVSTQIWQICVFLLVDQYKWVHVEEFIEECWLLVRLYVFSSAYVLFIFLGWFARWEVDGCTIDVLKVLPRVVQNSTQDPCVVSIKFFFSRISVKFQVVEPYRRTDTATPWKNSPFILSMKLDFHVVGNFAIVDHALSMSMLTLFSVNEIFLPRYMNWFTNFWRLPFNGEMELYWLKHMDSILSELTQIPMSFAAITRLCGRDLDWAGAFVNRE